MRKELVNEDLVQDKAAGQSILPSCCAEKSVMREELANEDLVQEKAGDQLILKRCWQRRLRHVVGTGLCSSRWGTCSGWYVCFHTVFNHILYIPLF